MAISEELVATLGHVVQRTRQESGLEACRPLKQEHEAWMGRGTTTTGPCGLRASEMTLTYQGWCRPSMVREELDEDIETLHEQNHVTW